jgi:hypothetical protein
MHCGRMTLPDVCAAAAEQHPSRNNKHKQGATMTLDDAYGSDQIRFPLEQEAADWDGGEAGLVWEEEDLESIARDLGVRQSQPA